MCKVLSSVQWGGASNKAASGLHQYLLGLAAIVMVLSLPGCATYSASVAQMETATANRDLDGAVKTLDDLKLSGADDTLHFLNKGTLLRLKGNYSDSNRYFDQAKNLMEKYSAISITEQAASVAVNDTLKAYEGLPSEQLMVYAFEALNYLQSDDVDGAAVEARQFDVKQHLIAEKNVHAKYLAGSFVRYLDSMVYESAGEKDEARIEMEKAIAGYKAQNSGFPVPKGLYEDLKRVETGKPAPSEVVFLLHNGLGPTLKEVIVRVPNPNPQNGSAVFSLAVPKFERRLIPVSRVVLSSEGTTASSEIVENVNDLAEKSLNDRLPAIIARGVARMVAKSVMVKEAKDKGGDLAGLFANVATTVSERADTRSWTLLPGNILMARLPLSAGKHQVTAKYFGASGNELGSHDFEVVVKTGRKTFASDYFLNSPDNIRVAGVPETPATQANVAPASGGGVPVAAIGQYASVAFTYAFSAGGYWLGSKDFEPGDWTKWTSSTGQAYVAEKAFLKKDENGNEWWRVIYSINREKDAPKQLILEGLFAPQRARLLRLRAQFPGQETGEIPVTEQQYYFPPARLTRESIEGAIVGKESVQVGAGQFNARKAVYSVMGAGVSEWWLTDKVPGGVLKYLFKAKKDGAPALEMELDSYGKNAKSVLGSF